MSAGFRWRILVLVGVLYAAWHLVRRRLPNPVSALAVLLVIFLVAGSVGVDRQYGRGLATEEIRSRTFGELLDPVFSEGRSLFYTTSQLIGHVSESRRFVGLAPLQAALVAPIPRQFLPDKDIGEYQKRALVEVYRDPVVAQAGLAILNYGEYFLAAGWVGILLGGIAFGVLCRWLWNWYIARAGDPLVLAIYTMTVMFLYLIVSRGFLPGVVILAGFSVVPLFLLRWWLLRRAPQRSLAP